MTSGVQATTAREADAALLQWFQHQGWRPAAFQRQVWRHWLRGESGLLVTPTGSGKTLAAFGGALLEGLREQGAGVAGQGRQTSASRLRVLWVTPLRALATDTTHALKTSIDALGLPWTVAKRTGDATSRDRRLARQGQAEVLVITPESLSLLLSYPETAAQLTGLRGVVVDEWHELLGNKRGVLLQLTLARIRALAPQAVTWGLSATIGNLEEARAVLLPHRPDAPLVRNAPRRRLTLKTLMPAAGERFSWAGHLGLSQLDRVMQLIAGARTAILFTNTRAQAELWYQALLEARPDWAGIIALHHASLARETRNWVEQSLKQGQLKAVVCTSSLDLGVDFLPVERVLQIGSAKGVARLMQRAGRSGHAPGRPSRVTLVPTHSLELVEAVAARQAIAERRIEARLSPEKPLDVLVQHLVSMALGAGFRPAELLEEVRSCWAYRLLRDEHWHWALAFVRNGGASLGAYPDYHRVIEGDDGKPAAARPLKELGDAVLATTSPHLFTNLEADAFMSVAKQVAEKKIVFGGDCYNYGLVASGHVDVVIEAGLKLYDYAALVPVVEGAGGMMADWQGNPLDAGSDGTVIALGDPARLEDVLEAMG